MELNALSEDIRTRNEEFKASKENLTNKETVKLDRENRYFCVYVQVLNFFTTRLFLMQFGNIKRRTRSTLCFEGDWVPNTGRKKRIYQP